MADREHLGRGLRFPVALDLGGGVATTALDDNVRQAIAVIVGTAPGERLGRPDFGCRIHDLMFAPNNEMTAARAEHYCQHAIAAHEPRVATVSVVATPNADEPNRLDLRIEYALAGRADKRSFVFPFYLEVAP
nr:GPW/gp25 family protein [Kofleriaceae bacterium]